MIYLDISGVPVFKKLLNGMFDGMKACNVFVRDFIMVIVNIRCIVNLMTAYKDSFLEISL